MALRKRALTFIGCFRKRRIPRWGGGGAVCSEKGRGGGGVATLEETMEPCQIYKMERFAKIVGKTLEFRSLKGF